jgi:hypothetical protein
MSGLISFLGGSVFRMMWGEVSAFITKGQEHKQEVTLIRLQAEIAKEAHERNLEALKLQHSLGVEQIYVQQEVAENQGELDAWVSATKAINIKSGIAWIDGWNQSIRPAVATVALIAMIGEIALLGHLTDFHQEVFGAALGLFLADRALSKRGK